VYYRDTEEGFDWTCEDQKHSDRNGGRLHYFRDPKGRLFAQPCPAFQAALHEHLTAKRAHPPERSRYESPD